MKLIFTVIIAVGLDLLFGDPPGLIHPVVLMGKCISRMDRSLRKHFPEDEDGEFRAGRLMALAMVFGTFCVTGGILLIIGIISPVLAFIIKFILAFVSAFIVTSLVELIASYMINLTSWEYVENGKRNSPWYYSASEGYEVNFQGRIALKSSLRFGIGSMFLLYLLQPAIQKFSTKKKVFKIVGSLLLVVFVADCIITFGLY